MGAKVKLLYARLTVDVYVEPDDPRLEGVGMYHLDDKVKQVENILEVLRQSFATEEVYLEVSS